MPVLLRWILAAMFVDALCTVVFGAICLFTGWSPVDPLIVLVEMIR